MDFFDEVYLLSQSWKYSKAFSIALKDFFTGKVPIGSLIIGAIGVVINMRDFFNAFFDDPRNSDYILY